MRIDIDLSERYRSIVSFTGLISSLCGLIMLTPLIVLAWHPAELVYARGFIFPGLSLAIAGFLLWRFGVRRRDPILSVQDGGVIVLLSWIIVTVVSAAPFMSMLRLSFTQAFFESVSAWTTTGLSVVDVEKAPRIILLWRSIMQLAGGAGMAIILVTSAGGPLGSGLAVAEGRSDQLVPHVRRSARLVLSIYSGYALVGSLALRLAGMSWFDAVNHAFAAVSTGGFSTRGASLGYFDSAAIEAVTIPLMVLGSTNFQMVYLMLRGRLRSTLRNAEVRTAGLLAAVAIPCVFFFVTSPEYVGALKQLRVAIFEVVSALTTTGFSTTTYNSWPAMGILILILLMIVGGGTGSTAGALKQYRAYLLTRGIFWELRRLRLPTRTILDTSVWRGDGEVRVTAADLAQTAAFAAIYLLIYIIGVGVSVGCGFDLEASLFEFASALGTVGLSVGVTGPGTPAPVLWTETVGMLLGRLEIFIVFVAVRKLLADGTAVLRGRGK